MLKLNSKTESLILMWYCFISYWSVFNITSYSSVLKLLVITVIPFVVCIKSGRIIKRFPIIIWIIFSTVYFLQIFIGNIKLSTGVAWTLQKIMIWFVMIWLIEKCNEVFEIVKIFCTFSIVFSLATLGEYLVPDVIHTISKILISNKSYSVVSEIYEYGYHSGIAEQVSYNACYITISLMICFAYIIGKKNNKRQLCCYSLGIALSATALILTGKRGMLAAAIVGIFVGLITVLIFRRGVKIKTLFIGVILFGFGVYLFSKTGVGENIIRRMQYADFLTGRDVLWSTMFEGIKKHPIIGNGSAALSLVLGITGHNVFLQLWFENGLVGLLLVLAFFGYGILYCLRMYKKYFADTEISCIILSSLLYQIYFIFACLTDSMFYHNTSLMCYLVLYMLPITVLKRRRI